MEPIAADANALGVLIVSPDRPGIGASTRAPARDTLSWTDDVDELLTHLCIDRFATMGYSMGGQYALAVAFRFSERVAAAGIVAGCIPLDDPATFAELNDMDKRFTHLSRHKPAVAKAAFRALGRLEGHFPERMATLSTRKSAQADRAATAANAELFGAMMSGAATDPGGLVDEYVAWVKPWRFPLDQIIAPVEIWQGSVDELVPPVWAHRMADAIPGSVLHIVEGEGHLIGITDRTAVVDRLREIAQEAHLTADVNNLPGRHR